MTFDERLHAGRCVCCNRETDVDEPAECGHRFCYRCLRGGHDRVCEECREPTVDDEIETMHGDDNWLCSEPLITATTAGVTCSVCGWSLTTEQLEERN